MGGLFGLTDEEKRVDDSVMDLKKIYESGMGIETYPQDRVTVG